MNNKRSFFSNLTVPYDQWLITHLDTSWTIKQVKHWILSKCNIEDAPDLPRYRSVSPITFASSAQSRATSFDIINNDKTNEEGEDEDSGEDGGYLGSVKLMNISNGRNSRGPTRRSESSTEDSFAVSAAISDLATRYTILTFSNTQVLDDDYVFSWCDIRPYELLEIHPVGSIIRLPREVMVQYVRPYFEARIKALHIVSKNKVRATKEAFVDRVGVRRSKSGGLTKKGLATSDPLTYDLFRDKNLKESRNKRRSKLEWRERWVIIHQGVLSLCDDRSVRFNIYLSFIR